MEEKNVDVVDVDGDSEKWGWNSKSGRHGVYVNFFYIPPLP